MQPQKSGLPIVESLAGLQVFYTLQTACISIVNTMFSLSVIYNFSQQ